MSWTKKSESIRSLTISFTVLSLFALCLFFGADFSTSEAKVARSANLGGTTFPGTGGGAIADGGVGGAQNPGTPSVMTFDVTGLSGVPTDVSLDMDATHTWVGDIVATLTAPDGTTDHIIMSYTGNTSPTSFGDSSDLGGLYTFTDTATNDWWAAAGIAPAASPVALGSYKASDNAGAQTDITPTFAGLATLNGPWTLSVTDGGAGDTGSLNAATLSITAGGGGPTADGDTDFDGDGTSDYAVTRDETPAARGDSLDPNSINFAAEKANNPTLRSDRKTELPKTNNLGAAPGTNLVWYAHNSGTPGTFNIAGHGEPGDQTTPADFDGDGSDDFAVWRGFGPAGPGGGFFFILNSFDSTVDAVDFGVTGDEAGIVGDYDGDGMADPAVYRQPGSAPFGPTTFFYKGSAGGGEITFQTWGDNTIEDLRAVRGDYDGDGKHDFVIHRTSPTNVGKGQYAILRSSDNGAEFIEYGNSGDLLFPADIDGDGMADFLKARVIGGNIEWYVMTKDGSRIDAAPTIWGALIAGTSEFAAPADYDGDGKDDIAVYRRDNADPDNCFYYILRSSDGMLQTFEFGASSDTPVQVWDQQF